MQAVEFKTAWHHPPNDLELQPDRVDIWRIPLDLPGATVKRFEASLSGEEASRAARFQFPADRRRYIAAHGGLRDILARYLDCQAAGLHFSANPYGKPVLEDYKLEFNLSHSGEVALLAITHSRKIGIDVERVRPGIEFERIARRFFSPNEVAELLALPHNERAIAFFDCWTRKEAYIKAHGLGLSLPLEGFDVSLIPRQPALLRATRPDPEEAGRWTLLALDAGPTYQAAVAVENPVLSLSKGAVLSLPKGAVPGSSPGCVERLSQRERLAFRFWDPLFHDCVFP